MGEFNSAVEFISNLFRIVLTPFARCVNTEGNGNNVVLKLIANA